MSMSNSEDVMPSVLSLFMSFSSTRKSYACELPPFFVHSRTSMNFILGDLVNFLINFISNLPSTPEFIAVNGLNGTESNEKRIKKSSSFIKTVLKCKYGFCIVVFQLSLKYCQSTGKCIVLCQVWGTIQSYTKSKNIYGIQSTDGLKTKRSIRMEKYSSMLAQLIDTIPFSSGFQV